MAAAKQKLVLIPQDWCVKVAAILRRADRKQIQTTYDAERDWRDAFPDAWPFDCYDSMAAALCIPGGTERQIFCMTPAGEVYAFWFYFRNRQLYEQINQLPDGNLILIHSRPDPRKGKEPL